MAIAIIVINTMIRDKNGIKGIRAKAKITVPKKMAKKQQTALKSRMKKAGTGKRITYKKKK